MAQNGGARSPVSSFMYLAARPVGQPRGSGGSCEDPTVSKDADHPITIVVLNLGPLVRIRDLVLDSLVNRSFLNASKESLKSFQPHRLVDFLRVKWSRLSFFPTIDRYDCEFLPPKEEAAVTSCANVLWDLSSSMRRPTLGDSRLIQFPHELI